MLHGKIFYNSEETRFYRTDLQQKNYINCKIATTETLKPTKNPQQQKKKLMLKGRLSHERCQRCSLIKDLDTDPIYYFYW